LKNYEKWEKRVVPSQLRGLKFHPQASGYKLGLRCQRKAIEAIRKREKEGIAGANSHVITDVYS